MVLDVADHERDLVGIAQMIGDLALVGRRRRSLRRPRGEQRRRAAATAPVRMLRRYIARSCRGSAAVGNVPHGRQFLAIVRKRGALLDADAVEPEYAIVGAADQRCR